MENRFKSELKNKRVSCVWTSQLIIIKSVCTAMLGAMESLTPLLWTLLAGERYYKCTAGVIANEMLSTTQKIKIWKKELLMLMTDGVANMLFVCRSLKQHCSNLLGVISMHYGLWHKLCEVVIQK